MQTQTFQGSQMTRAFIYDQPITVQFWVPGPNDEAYGYGIVDGRMKRLEVQPGFERYEVQ